MFHTEVKREKILFSSLEINRKDYLRPKWNKLGCVFNTTPLNNWIRSRAFLPTPIIIEQDTIRVYCAFLDNHNIGRIGFVDISASNPLKVIGMSTNTILDIGCSGTFDEHGVTPSCIIRHQKDFLMYYIGWQRFIGIPYTLLSGLATHNLNKHFYHRTQVVPLLERTNDDMHIRAAPFVVQNGNSWRIWYTGGYWQNSDNGLSLKYGIKTIISDTPYQFLGAPEVCLPISKEEDIVGYGRPYIILKNGVYLIWYSERKTNDRYSIKFAISKDGIKWNSAAVPLPPGLSSSGWDSEMVAFSAVLETKYGTYMFYNGNGYGSTGFGCAKLDGTLDDICEANRKLIDCL